MLIDPKGGRSNAAVVGPCFEVQGRAFASNGPPSLRILLQGTQKVLGLLPAENEIAPQCLRSNVTFDSDVAGHFTVCPFTRDKVGSMQMVCVEEVRNAVVRSTAAMQHANTAATSILPAIQNWPRPAPG